MSEKGTSLAYEKKWFLDLVVSLLLHLQVALLFCTFFADFLTSALNITPQWVTLGVLLLGVLWSALLGFLFFSFYYKAT